MPNDPSYVRLANRLTRGMVADVETGWSIAGLDVRRFPEGKQAARFVRLQLREGKLEPASKAEWEEVHDDPVEQAMLAQRPDFRKEASRHQEAVVQRAATQGTRRLVENRSADEEEDPEDRIAARKARIAQQNEEDDSEGGPSRSSAPRKAKKAKKAKKAPRKPVETPDAESDESDQENEEDDSES